MSENTTENTTSEVLTENAEPAKKGGKMKLIIIVLIVVLLGAGGGYYFFLRPKAETEETAEKSEKETKKNTKKDSKKEEKEEEEETESESESSSSKNPSKTSLDDALVDDEDVKNIIELQPFIVNLADDEQARYLRMTVSVGIGGEEGESEKPDTIFITRVRNAMLAVLSVKKSEDVLSVKGKAKLRKELLNAAQKASEEPEVKAIYITDFIVQL